jgi:hypothetical protein
VIAGEKSPSLRDRHVRGERLACDPNVANKSLNGTLGIQDLLAPQVVTVAELNSLEIASEGVCGANDRTEECTKAIAMEVEAGVLLSRLDSQKM